MIDGAGRRDHGRVKEWGSCGYAGAGNECGDMLKKGIIDPAKGTRTGLENAASIAALVLTTESLVTEMPQDTPSMPGGPPPMPDY